MNGLDDCESRMWHFELPKSYDDWEKKKIVYENFKCFLLEMFTPKIDDEMIEFDWDMIL